MHDVGGAGDAGRLFLSQSRRRSHAQNRSAERECARRACPAPARKKWNPQITQPIETAVQSISGHRRTANDCQSRAIRTPTITFTLEKDIDVAVQDVRDKIAPLVNRFGTGRFGCRSITKVGSGRRADTDACRFTAIATPKELSEHRRQEDQAGYGDDQRRRRSSVLRRSPAADPVAAERRPVDRIWPDRGPGASGHSAPERRDSRRHVHLGTIRNRPAHHGTAAERHGLQPDHSVPEKRSVVTFGDVGRVADTVEEPRSIARVDGQNSVALSITQADRHKHRGRGR